MRPISTSSGVVVHAGVGPDLSKPPWAINDFRYISDVIMSDGVLNHQRFDFLLNRSSADQRKHQRSTSLAFVRGNHRWPVDSPHKGPVTRNVFIWWRHEIREPISQLIRIQDCESALWFYASWNLQRNAPCFTNMQFCFAFLKHGENLYYRPLNADFSW